MGKKETPLFHDLFHEQLPRLLTDLGVDRAHVDWVGAMAGAAATAAVLLALAHALNMLFTLVLRRLARRTATRFDDNLVAQRVPAYLGRIIPLLLAFRMIPSVLEAYPRLIRPLEHLVTIFFIVLAARIIRAVLHASHDTLQAEERYKGKPLGSYVQVLSLTLYILAGLAIFSQLTGLSIGAFLMSMGAASAVLLLIFKDTILGFVASIQISANDMVRVGDYITMPNYGADGDVTEINVTTVKVLNADKTITTVPTYALISDSFQNWRGLKQTGARLIKRSIRIKISSIRFLRDEELDGLRRIQLLTGYIDERREEIRRYNAEHGADKSILANGRNLTNVGLFRRYMERYALEHPGVHPGLTRMVRQLPPDERGLPLELYCYSRDPAQLGTEKLAADLFDHLLAATGYFGLEVFENPASGDLRFVGERLAGK